MRHCLQMLPETLRAEWKFDLEQSTLTGQKDSCLLCNEKMVVYENFAQAASKLVEGPVLLLYICGGEHWGYFLWDCGKEMDAFSPRPDYFGGDAGRYKGNVNSIARCFKVPRESITGYLTPWKGKAPGEKAYPDDTHGYEAGQVEDFVRKLGFSLKLPDPPEGPDTPSGGIFGRLLAPLKRVFQRQIPASALLTPPDVIQITCGGDKTLLEKMDLQAFTRFAKGIFSRPFDRLELSYRIQGEGFYNKRTRQMTYRYYMRAVVLYRDKGRYLLLCFDDAKATLYQLIYDREAYRTVDVQDLKTAPFYRLEVQEYLVHPNARSVKPELFALLKNILEPYGVLDRLTVWSWELCASRPQTYQKLKVEKGLFDEGTADSTAGR